jgi:hypothetical protein
MGRLLALPHCWDPVGPGYGLFAAARALRMLGYFCRSKVAITDPGGIVWIQASPGWRTLPGSQAAGCGTLPDALETICARGLLLPLSLGAHNTRRSGALRCALSRARFTVRGVHACVGIIGGENLDLFDVIGSQFPSVEY